MSGTLDLVAIGKAVGLRRRAAGTSLTDLATALGSDEADLRLLEKGDEATRIGTTLRAIAWIEADVADFVTEQAADHHEISPAEREERISAFLRSDRDIKPEDAEAVEAVLHAAYARFSAA